MTAEGIRALIAQSADGIDHLESGECPSGMGLQLTILGEIAAQLADFNQNLFEVKHQITQGYLNVVVRAK